MHVLTLMTVNSLSSLSAGLPLERAINRPGCKDWDCLVRYPPIGVALYLLPDSLPGLPEMLTQQAQSGQHHCAGPSGCRRQRWDFCFAHSQCRASEQHQLWHIRRRFPDGLPSAALRGNPDQDNPCSKSHQWQRCGMHKDGRSRGQTVSRTQIQRALRLNQSHKYVI